MRRRASALARPEKGPESESTPSSVEARSERSPAGSGSPRAGWMTTRIGRPVGLCELEVALVVRRHAHDGTGAVLGEDEVGDPHRDLLARERVHRVGPGEYALLGRPLAGSLRRLGVAHPRDKRVDLGPAGRAR